MRGSTVLFRAFFVASTLLFSGLAASGQELFGKTIRSIDFDPAVQPIGAHDLEDALVIRVGEPLERNPLAATIDRLFRSGLYEDVKADVEPRADGVALRFITIPRKFIGHIGARGDIKDPPSRAVIISDSQLYLGQPFDADDLIMARKNLEQEMRDNGLFQAHVDTATIEDPLTHQVTMRFVVEAGKRARYETPSITGDTKLSDSTIIRATGWRWPLIRKWRQVTAALTDKGVQGVQQKYGKKDRLTALVSLTSLDYDPSSGYAKPSFQIDAGPKVSVKALEAKVSKSKLKQLVPIYQEGSVDNDLLAEGARNLTDYFQARGYPGVDVTFRRDPPKNDEEVIDYVIATGPRRRLVDVAIEGNNYFLDSTLRERMFLQPKSLLLRYGRYSESFRKRDEEAIASLYSSNGFRDVKVSSAVQPNYGGKTEDIAVTYSIAEGPQWKVANLSVVGPAQLDISGVEKDFASIQGQPFADVNVATDRNRILEYYFSNGFPSASFRYTIEPGSDTATINLTYHVNEGPREFVRRVVISGLYRTKSSLVDRLITVHENQPISVTRMNDDARNLSALGVFANVNTAIQNPDGGALYKDVLYDFDEAARYSFSVGLGLIVGQFGGTTTDPTQAGGAKGTSPIVSFNVSRLNLFGVGQTLSLQTNYSTLQQREALSYTVPRFLGSTNRTVTFTILYDTTQDVQTFSSRRLEASVQTSQRLSKASTLATRFAYRRVSTADVNIPALLIPQFLQPVRIGILSTSYIQDHRDNPADAHSGFWNTIDAGVAGKFFGSERSFVRVLARNATYTSLGRKLVLARQTQIGTISPFNKAPGTLDYDAIPLPERFFGGGSVSMRGFGNNQAGPRDIGTPNELPGTPTAVATGFPIGGNALFFNNVELRFPLLGPNISGVLFEDMGNIYTTFNNLSFAYRQKNEQDFNYAVQSPGIGIRYKTPLGPVRVDFAYVMNPPRYLGFSANETYQDLLQCTEAELNKIPACTPGPQRLSHFQFFFSIGQAF